MNYFYNPLEQFNIFATKYCLTTNYTSILIIHFILIVVCLYFAGWSVVNRNANQFFSFEFFKIVKNDYQKNTGLKIGIFLPVFCIIFLIVLFNNIFGLIPYSYAITSSLIINFYIILSLFLMINIIGIFYHKWNFFNIFMPKGLPLLFTWFLIFFETVSYLARVFSLTIRLFANIVAGHILQHILIGFAFEIFLINSLLGYSFIFPWGVTFLVTLLELAICFLQAYVLLILLLIYFGNTINLH